MRSRYTAYVKREYAHLGTSLSTEQRKDYSPEDAKSWAEKSEWLGLTIHGTSQGGVDDTTGLVDFSAKFKTQGQEQEHRETAIFNRENGRWVYSGHTEMAGTPVRRESPKVGRNDPCPCGSGKKFKKCCGGV
jgi:SEC-C motif-containing protein